ncbi:sulfatase-like hydrolase/transferase [Iamia sp. SCSIO 61187]|uniref:sulfatase-like hydrolase/transferase n=1 Tax=Iamia sp. SCSIO 61187 TaxID=2722752 RepID=UPI001C62B085|nr:sulfatase-like hydrolase/transferase [Iamia sp. SCSIO 61187]QYG94882.1 sulfatase-like hydrolase/transferase [Iamia sp. SCSIO 61187]
MAARPNVVLIVTDQHRLDHTGFGGSAVVQTPHLDALAARATSFTEAFAANPICMPNRATLLTGRMPSAHGTRCNGIALDWDASTCVRELRRAGYRTGLVGKAHFQNMGFGRDMVPLLRAGLAEPDAVVRPRPPGWDGWEDEARYAAGDVDVPEDFYGFDHVELTVGHGDVMSGHYLRWLIDRGVDPATSLGAEVAAETSPHWWQAWRPALPAELHPTAFVGERGVAFVEDAARGDDPFFLQVSFPDPHHPFCPPDEYWSLYDPDDLELPATFDDPHEASPAHLRAWRQGRGAPPPAIPVLPFSPTAEVWREAAAKEYGSITLLDRAIGGVLDALEATGAADDTVVIFTSDHAEMFGDHGLMLKAAMHYRPALRVPLLVARPGQTVGAESSSLVGSIDVAQTILDLCGVDPYEGMQGHSLRPVLDDPAVAPRDQILVEEDEPFDLAGLGQPLRMRTLITAAGRLSVYRGSEEGELFALDDDPDEMANRFADPGAAGLRAEMFERLAVEQMVLSDAGTTPTCTA